MLLWSVGLPFVSVAAAVACRSRAVRGRWQGSCSCVALGSFGEVLWRCCQCVRQPLALWLVADARALCRSHPEIQPYHSGRSRAELGPGLDASTPVRRALAHATPRVALLRARPPSHGPPRGLRDRARSFYYIKLEDEEPREVAGSPSNDGPPARLRQRPEARPERREREGRREP